MSAIIIQVVALLIAIAGLLFSYADFRHTLSHRWLGERFHLGVYLFWLVWMAICVFILLKKRVGLTKSDDYYLTTDNVSKR
jgi:hypothetical protein